MSRTLFVRYRGHGFWVYDVVSSIYAKFLIDAAEARQNASSEKWLLEAINNWRINCVVSDFGFFLNDDWSKPHVATVVELCRESSRVIRDHGEFNASEVESEVIHVSETYISRIFCRGHELIPCEPVARFGDAIVSLLRGTFSDPPKGKSWWFYTLEEEVETLGQRTDS